MSTASQQQRCPKCGGPILPEAPQGLCPKCLLAEVSIPTEAGYTSKSSPPSNEELAAAFPHLEILELIGQGGMGFVFKARQPKLDRFVALKILPQSLAGDPAFAERFTREGRVLARLNHPNIVTIHDFGQANGFFYLLMEFVDGVNLRQAMRAGRFTSAQALGIVPRICDALQYAHDEGVLHRDIKPENILLDAKGRVKIADFGIGKMIGEASAVGIQPSGCPADTDSLNSELQLTQAGTALGTPQYMAPEQRERPDEVDHRADIYSLGVVFYELLTGELPVGKFAPPSEKSAADPRLDSVVRQALEKERDRRQQSAGEVRTQVETIAARSAPKTEARRPARSAFLALGLFLAGTLGTLLLMTISHRHEMALIFGATALLLALIFGAMSWRERLGKGVVIAILTLVVGLGITAAVLAGGYLLVGNRTASEARRQELRARADQTRALQQVSPKPDAFVRIVTGTNELTFEGQQMTWEELPKALAAISNRSNTVLELAVSSNDLTMAQLNELQGRANVLSRQFGFEYLSFIGVHPLGSKGSSVDTLDAGAFMETWTPALPPGEKPEPVSVASGKAPLSYQWRRAATGGTNEVVTPTTDMMRALATHICEGDGAAFGELRAIATELYRNIDYAKEQGRVRTNLSLMRAAFRELGEQAGRSNAHAMAALQSAAFTSQMKAHVADALGVAAAAGNEHALDMLLNHQDWNMLLSSAVFALRAPAEKGNERAIDFLIAVLEDPKHRALWYETSRSLRTTGANGNAKAKAAVEKYQQANPK